ncbi:related to ATP-dependent (S)-NAD(P)H-hydrate dehydratase [Saccharomycodes ludwigii]|uniref:ATP-dependent (S)-NAD(P)H-hydrate dehydratase n=1 Tax=Saccharomycodes ludwigii TaxID=36035 RepID=A0A376BAE3_9ASCO|nr:hypothetical protein SCDLUD_004770 [Saccharomycodes ludwigii]KAH3899331.1 hypothetical protein SCDLUD_004770 [Saccharomycodes ludwigii]SSD61655.1 related to ATP-dependent (S)-NAD(P)H-hydrate dehydratase [Saccharomycodes ludwigii]
MSGKPLSSLSHLQLIKLAKKTIIPPLKPHYYKGQLGKVCVVGGCLDYTGAPYFSAHAAALFGCDLTHVLCEYNAAQVIKGYTPNLMVHPYLNYKENDKNIQLIKRMQCVVVGPGLGRRDNTPDNTLDNMYRNVVEIIEYCIDHMIPLILDADALYLLSNDLEYRDRLCAKLSSNDSSKNTILTPNIIELKRLLSTYPDLYKKFSNLVILEKGETDRIKLLHKDGTTTELHNNESGSWKRVGGQGDTLTGVLATLLSWCNVIENNSSIKVEADDENDGKLLKDHNEYRLLACYVASTVVRNCSKLAYKEHGRSMQTTDLNDNVGRVYNEMF